MPISRAQPADVPELAELFAGYLDFYQVPRPLPEVSAFLAARLERGDSVLFIARDQAGQALGFVQLYPFSRRCTWRQPSSSAISTCIRLDVAGAWPSS